MSRKLSALIKMAFVASLGLVAVGRADTILFQDNFDENVISAPAPDGGFNYTSFTNWTVAGEVDLIGLTGPGDSIDYYNFPVQSGHGLYVDLTGTVNVGSITSDVSYTFAAGVNYTLSFDLANNVGSSTNQATVSIALGDTTYTFPTPQSYNFTNEVINITGNNSTTAIVFAETDGDNDSQGVLLDNVVLTQLGPTGVGASPSTPLPASLWTGVALLAGLAVVGKIRKRHRC